MNTKQVVLIFLLVIFAGAAKSQDLVVTNEGDSLNCKITKMKSGYIYFTFKHNDEIRSTLLSAKQIKFHQFNYYQKAVVPREKIAGNEIYPHFRLSINGGWGYRLAKVGSNTPSGLTQYVKELKSGYQYNVDGAYYFSEQLGVGLKYNSFRSKNATNYQFYGNISDDITINFIGPMFCSRLFLNGNKTNCFIMNIGMGYVGYNNNSFVGHDLTIKGSTFGSVMDIGYEVALSKSYAINFQVSLLSGTLSQYEVTEWGANRTVKLDKSSYESLTRIDLSIGFRFSR